MAEQGENRDQGAADRLLEENRQLAQRFLELEESSRRRIAKLESLNALLRGGDSDMRRMVEDAAFSFILLNRDLMVTSANQALCSLLGYSLAEVSGMDFRQFVYVEKLAAFIELADRAASDGKAEGDIDLMRRSGDIVPCRMSFSPWKSEKNDIQGVLVLAIDVSNEVRAADLMRKLRENAIENQKTQDLLSGIIDREIRAPANAIMGMARMLSATDLGDRQRELVDVIHSSAHALAKLVDGLREMTGPGSSDPKLNLVPFRAAELCREVTGFFSTRAEEKGIVLDIVVAPGVPEAVTGDAGRVKRVLLHLMDNALKFTDEGRATVSVDVMADKLRFMVSDTGKGLPAGSGDEIFEDFGGAVSSESRRLGKLGLGLAICRRLVVRMGGKIGFESSPGRGTEFHFTIPLIPANADDLPGSRVDVFGPALLRLPPLRILVSEGNHMLRRTLAAVLGLDGHRLVIVDDGFEAAERCGQEEFDLLLLDPLTPKLDGVQTLRVIRDSETKGRRTPALALTAPTQMRPAEYYLKAGFDGVVAKPLRPEDLMDAIGKATGVEPLSLHKASAPAGYRPEKGGAPLRRIDGRQFANVREIMPEEQFVGMLRVFAEDSVPDVVRLVRMAREPEPDRERVVFIANKARGMSGYLGFSDLADALAAMAGAGKSGMPDRALAELADEIEAVMDDTLEELKRIAPNVFATMSDSLAAEGDEE